VNWWGKVLGGGFGFLIGGPIGALIGAVLGHNFDSGLQRLQLEEAEDLKPGAQERVQATFFTATFAAEQRKVAIDLFQQGKDPNYDVRAVVEQFRRECGRRTNLMRMFIEIQLHAVYADGTLHPAEEKLLEDLCEYLKFPKFMLRQMEILVRAGRTSQQSGSQSRSGRVNSRSTDMSVADACELLGVDASNDKSTVKRAYRKMMSQHHPDKLVAKGLPPEMIKLATEKTQHIKAAYELIKEARGWK